MAISYPIIVRCVTYLSLNEKDSEGEQKIHAISDVYIIGFNIVKWKKAFGVNNNAWY